MRGNSFIFIALRSKILMNRVRSCAFKEVVSVADNKNNFNGNPDNWGKDRLLNWRWSNLLLEDWEDIFVSEIKFRV